jgi:hypothetical protein
MRPSSRLGQNWPRLYHKNVIDHYENPRNVGTLDRKDKSVGTGLVGAPACGDVLRLQIKVYQLNVVQAEILTGLLRSMKKASSAMRSSKRSAVDLRLHRHRWRLNGLSAEVSIKCWIFGIQI